MNKILEKKLSENKIKYELIQHKKVFTAHDKAATLKVKPKVVGKTLVLRINGGFAIALLSASKNLNKGKLKTVINQQRKKDGLKPIKKIDFVTEAWMKKNLKGAKIGAVPPFGILWKFPTFVDKSLLKEKAIFVNVGNYNQSLKLSPKIFQKIANCILGNFSKPR